MKQNCNYLERHSVLLSEEDFSDIAHSVGGRRSNEKKEKGFESCGNQDRNPA